MKRPTQNERILALLTDGKPHSFHEVLRHVPCVVHSRVAELRSRGHDITCERVDGDYRYVLHSSPLSEPDVDAGLLLGRTTAPSGSLSGVTLGDGDGNDAAQLTLIPEQPRRELWAA